MAGWQCLPAGYLTRNIMKNRILLISLLISSTVFAQRNLSLIDVYHSSVPWNGVTTTDDGRVFVCFPRLEGDSGMRIGEIKANGKVVPYPDASWNSWKKGEQTGSKIVRANSLRVGPDGNLWIVDTGAEALGKPPLPNASKLIVINIRTNKIKRVIPLQSVMKTNSFIDDLRIYGPHIYLTDAGEPGIVVMDLISGKGRRVLENHPAVTDVIPMVAEGKIMKMIGGKDLHINADQLEISPDGKYFYFQPAAGHLARIKTKYLNNPQLSKAQLADKVEKWNNTPSTGGTAIDAKGNIYYSDVNHLRIVKIDPQGKSTVVLKDSRLIWCDALWIDKSGNLWMPCGQLNRIGAFQGGQSKVSFPVHIYKMKIGAPRFKS
jgi:sugar lactone lactonase YvrE